VGDPTATELKGGSTSKGLGEAVRRAAACLLQWSAANSITSTTLVVCDSISANKEEERGGKSRIKQRYEVLASF